MDYDYDKNSNAADNAYSFIQQGALMQARQLHIPSLSERIGSRLTQAKAEVKRLEELASLLAKNPELTRAIELLGTGKELY